MADKQAVFSWTVVVVACRSAALFWMFYLNLLYSKQKIAVLKLEEFATIDTLCFIYLTCLRQLCCRLELILYVHNGHDRSKSSQPQTFCQWIYLPTPYKQRELKFSSACFAIVPQIVTILQMKRNPINNKDVLNSKGSVKDHKHAHSFIKLRSIRSNNWHWFNRLPVIVVTIGNWFVGIKQGKEKPPKNHLNLVR